MHEIKITGETHREFLSNLRAIAGGLLGEQVMSTGSDIGAGAVADASSGVPATRQRRPRAEGAAAPNAANVEASTAQTASTPPPQAAGAGAVTREMVRIKSQELNAGGHREKLMATIKAYGVQKLSEVPDDKMPEIMEKFKAIA